MLPGRIHVAVTSHGLGHWTRTAAVASELLRLHPGLSLLVSTEIAKSRLQRDLPVDFEHRFQGYEPGALQRSCFEVDREGTRAAYARFLEERPERISAERAFLRANCVTGVFADVPPLALRAAHEEGIPAVSMGNFTWDWILEPYYEDGGGDELLGLLASDQSLASAHLQLPLGPELRPCDCTEVVPLVCREATLQAEETRRRLSLGAPAGRRLVLVCPGGWDPSDWPAIHVAEPEFDLVTVGDLPISSDGPLQRLPHALAPGVEFPDLVAAADVVLAKPGYGIASECLQHRTPAVFIERPDFRETPVLLAEARSQGPFEEISLADFFAGDWGEPLSRALRGQVPWSREPADNRAVARRVAHHLGVSGALC